MGSFYATCSITDLSITDGDDMYMQLIIPTWVTNPYSIDGERVGCGEKGLRVSNEGALAEFVPFGFPIEGKYADYGNIDNIVKTHNIEMLEEFFNLSIENIIDCATDDRWYKHGYKPAIEENKEEEYKGQYKSWVIGDNKMTNIDILKKLTVTYFRKEHYDFLSKEPIGSDTYYNKERKTRLDKMVKSLTKLDENRPKDGKRKVFDKKNITDKIREKYKAIRKENSTDEQFDDLITEMQSYLDGSWWDSELSRMYYIPDLARVNMFKILPIGALDAEEVTKQYIFISNMYDLYKVLRPSYYGSQSNNFDAYVKFHEFSTNMVNENKMTLKADTILSDVAYILNDKLKSISNKEIIDSIKNGITESLEDCGYIIKF